MLWRQPDTGSFETWFEVVHAVLPNTNRDTGKLNAKNKRFSSIYYEPGGSGDKLLSESGFDEMPILVPRWDINGEDAYGSSCHGILALGGVKALQLQQKRKDRAIDKLVNPPMMAPSSMKNERLSLLPAMFPTTTAPATRLDSSRFTDQPSHSGTARQHSGRAPAC